MPIAHSLILNTACGDAMTAGKRNPYRSRRYGERTEMLRHTLSSLPEDWHEVIIAGTFPQHLAKEFPQHIWIAVPPKRHNRWDGLHQRDMGARFATGDTLTFCHDDHKPHIDYVSALNQEEQPWDILVPERIHMETGEILNNGREEGYMGGHCYTMKRWLWAALPLTEAPDEWWDIWLTPRWLQLGAKMLYSTKAKHYDVEATPDET